MCTATDFLSNHFGATTESPVFITSLSNSDVPKKGAPRHIITRDLDETTAFVAEEDRAGRSVYFCTATLKEGAAQRSKKTLSELTGIHVDIDFKMSVSDPDEILATLRALEFPPSKIVSSGGGFHVYWLFPEGITATGAEIARHEDLLKRLAFCLGGDPQCAESSRIMRLPGTHNSKGGAWVEVTTTHCSDVRYEFAELEDWLANETQLLKVKEATGKPNGAQNPFEEVGGRPERLQGACGRRGAVGSYAG